MDERIVKGTDEGFPFRLVSASDHTSGLTGAIPAVLISKAGGPFLPPAGAVVEVGNGSYRLVGSTRDSDTVGPLLLHATADGADPMDTRYEVVSGANVPPLVAGSLSYPLTFLLIDAADHIQGMTGLSPAVTISKAGGAFAVPEGSILPIGFGWYKLTPAGADTDTPGNLLLHATAPGAHDADESYDVAPAPPTAGSALEAIQAYFLSLPDLIALTADGRLYANEAPEGTPLPYAVVFEVADVPDLQGDLRTLSHVTVQFNLAAATIRQAKAMGRTWQNAFDVLPSPLAVGGEPVQSCRRIGGQLQKGFGMGPGGQDCWMQTIDYQIDHY